MPTLSAAIFHISFADVFVVDTTARFDGAEGGILSEAVIAEASFETDDAAFKLIALTI